MLITFFILLHHGQPHILEHRLSACSVTLCVLQSPLYCLTLLFCTFLECLIHHLANNFRLFISGSVVFLVISRESCAVMLSSFSQAQSYSYLTHVQASPFSVISKRNYLNSTCSYTSIFFYSKKVIFLPQIMTIRILFEHPDKVVVE